MLLSSRHWPPFNQVLVSAFIGSTALLGKIHEDADYTAMITIVHLCLCDKTQHGGEVVSAVIIFGLLLAAIAHSTRTAWSSCVICVHWSGV